MKKLWIVTKNELMRYFISPLAYVYLVAFLVLNAVMAFYVGNLFERGQASLEAMFWYQPWLYLLFIPGISMRLWAEEFRNKTVIQIMTMPVATETLVWGKFLAAWIFCALALGLTFPFWITINLLGDPDNAVILVSYVGSFVLAGCMLSISQTMSALTKNQVIALVLAVIANLVFFWTGVEFILSFFRLFLPDYMVDAIASFSFLTHFGSISQGLVELRDVLFFTSIILLFNFSTVLIVSFRTAGTVAWLKSTNRSFYIAAWTALVLGFMGFNLLANNLTRGAQVDLSQDKVFTLSQSTKTVLQNLPEPVIAKLYFSNILEQRNPAMRQMFDRVRSLLQQYKTHSNGRFDFRIYHPQNLNAIEDRAIADGLQPVPLIDINQNALFGMVLSDTLKNKQVIPFFTPERMSFLEPDITAKIFQLSNNKKTIAILSSLPINGEGGTESMIFQPWEIVRKLHEFYNVKFVQTPQDLKDHPSALVLIHPQELAPEMVEAIKQYSQNYGNILLLLDSAAEAPRLYSAVNHPFVPSSLSGLDEFWGIKFYNEYAIADLDNSITVDATSNYKNNPAYTQDIIQFKLKKDNLNPTHPITKGLQNVLMSSASLILPTTADVDFVPLLQASKNSSLMPISVVYDGLNPRQVLTYFKPDNNPKILAAAVHGKNPQNQFNLIVVGDTDFIYDNFWASSQTFLDKTVFIPLFNNVDFILNSLDYLTNSSELLGIRGKSLRNREFADIEKLRKNNVFEYKIKEEEIFNRINETKQQLQEIWGKKDFEERETFTADELALISGIRKQLDNLRQELSLVKTRANQDIEHIALRIKIINTFAVPLILSLILLAVIWLKRSKKSNKSSFEINRQILKLGGLAILILIAGIASVYLTNQSDIQKYEDKPLLPELASEINNIEEIKIENHLYKLVFIKNDTGIWTLKSQPDFPVYQERIRSFLSALIEARFYEKKSDKAENLSLFGLSPIEIAGSPNTRVELISEQGMPLQSFEVGQYDIELGRGSKAAYIKFDGQFQVWLAEADFIDLSTQWQSWTYSSLWNLRFGRVDSINGETNSDQVSNVVKHLLNTAFKKASNELSAPKEIGSLEISAENDNKIKLNFYNENNAYWVKYDFLTPASGKHLQFFASYIKNKFLEISASDWEKIKNAAKIK